MDNPWSIIPHQTVPSGIIRPQPTLDLRRSAKMARMNQPIASLRSDIDRWNSYPVCRCDEASDSSFRQEIKEPVQLPGMKEVDMVPAVVMHLVDQTSWRSTWRTCRNHPCGEVVIMIHHFNFITIGSQMISSAVVQQVGFLKNLACNLPKFLPIICCKTSGRFVSRGSRCNGALAASTPRRSVAKSKPSTMIKACGSSWRRQNPRWKKASVSNKEKAAMKMWDVHLQSTSISDHSDGATAISAFNTLILLRNCDGRAQSCSCPVCCAGLWGVDPLRPQVATCNKSNDSYRWRFVRSRAHDFETTKTNFGHMYFEWHAAVPWKRTNRKHVISC